MFLFGKKKTKTEETIPEQPKTESKSAGEKAKVEAAKPAREEVQLSEKPEAELKAKVKVVENVPCKLTLSVEIPRETIQKEMEKACVDIQKQARLPGFRAGKSPLDAIQANFPKEIYNQTSRRVINLAISKAVEEAEKTTGKEPLRSHLIEAKEFSYEKPFVIKLAVEVPPEFKLADYKGIPVRKTEKKVTDEAVNKELDNLRASFARLVEASEDALALTHIAIVDYEVMADNVPVSELAAKGRLIDMSAPGEVAGLPEALLGAKAGETKSLKVTVPKDSPNKDLAGKELEFKITLKGIKTKKLPDINDDWAKETGCQGLEDLKSRITSSLAEAYARDTRLSMERQIIEKLLGDNVFPLPPSYVEEEARHLEERFKASVKQQTGKNDGQAGKQAGAQAEEELPKDVKEKCMAEGERRTRLYYIFSEIYKAENIKVTLDEVKEFNRRILESVEAKDKSKTIETLWARRGQTAAKLSDDKIIKLLLGYANITTETITTETEGGGN